jgi:hypothetical protein
MVDLARSVSALPLGFSRPLDWDIERGRLTEQNPICTCRVLSARYGHKREAKRENPLERNKETHELTAYSKNSETTFVDPDSAMDRLLASFP